MTIKSSQHSNLKIYLVGGAIRDEMLGLKVKERDWVVVGATPEILLKQGFQPVGKDFPVFLHPDTHEEYALARTERKTGKGYQGFVFHTDVSVTLEEDLKRRDLTINAMARAEDGTLFDPYHGQADLKARVLRHVSLAFAEDPVRILRIARFAAKLHDFTVDPKTYQLMKNMVENGEVNALVAERVWQEFSRALAEAQPTRFFEVLQQCGALDRLFPALSANPHTFLQLKSIAKEQSSPLIQFAILMQQIKLPILKEYIKRYRIPKNYAELALLTNQFTSTYENILHSEPEAILQFIKKTDPFRRPDRFTSFLEACHICINNADNPQRHQKIKSIVAAIKHIDLQPLKQKNLPGPLFANELKQLQISTIEKLNH